MWRAALLAVAAAAVAAAFAAWALTNSAAAAPPLVLTEAESGSRVVVVRPRRVMLRLDDRWRWSRPRTVGDAVTLVRVRYESNPGFVEWNVRLVARGRATVSAAGEPNCRSCAREPRRLELTFVVR